MPVLWGAGIFIFGIKADICSPIIFRTSSGRSVARSSRLVWDQEVASSNLAAPTFSRLVP